ncbi:MAG: AAA family ATPase [bacterium]
METAVGIFDGLVGQPKARELLGRAVANEVLAQTLIFVGPKGVGRKTTAILLARALHQDEMTNHPDTFIFSQILSAMREHKKGIKDAVDELRKFMELSPIRSQIKAAIIDEAEGLSIGAQNALLKTLEEPHADTILILITEDERRLLPTIVSRAQVIRFSPLTDEEIQQTVPGVAPDLLAAARGSLGFVKEMLAHPDRWEDFQQAREFWLDIERQSLEDKFKWAEKVKERTDAVEFLTNGIVVLREKLLQAPDAKIAGLLARMQEAIDQIKDNVNTRAALEALLLVF